MSTRIDPVTLPAQRRQAGLRGGAMDGPLHFDWTGCELKAPVMQLVFMFDVILWPEYCQKVGCRASIPVKFGCREQGDHL